MTWALLYWFGHSSAQGLSVHEESSMKITGSRGLAALLCAGAIGLVTLAIVLPSSAQQNNAKQAKGKQAAASKSKYVSPPGYITGTVTGEKGPEAGVWVIAETKDLPTGFIKIVVTNDQGKFLIPDLPANATYKVWSRGYGLLDSASVDMKPSATA